MSEQKDIKYYLSLPYTVQLQREDEETWFARVVELPGCMTEGDSAQEAAEMILDAMAGWVEVALADGDAIPEPRPAEDYSGKFVVRVPRSLHRELVQAAERDGVSLNSFVNVALGRAVGQSPTRKQVESSALQPAWPRLSAAARQAMLDAGCEVEAQELNEQLFAQWVERNIEDVQATLASGQFQDAAMRLGRQMVELQGAGGASPLMGVFCRIMSLLQDQVEQNEQLRFRLVNQDLNQEQMIRARAYAQVAPPQPAREPREITYSASGHEQVNQWMEDILKKMGAR